MIGTVKESSLHASLKKVFTHPGDQVEAVIGQYHIDIVNSRELIEIQTGNFSKIRPKLQVLLPDYAVRLVFPLSVERWIIRVDNDLRQISRRRSPKRGQILDIFSQLVFIATLIRNPNFSLVVALVSDELVYINDGKGSWRRKGWSVYDRKLVRLNETILFSQPSDYLAVLPDHFPEMFRVQDLVTYCRVRKRLATQIAYSLFHMGIVDRIGKMGNAWVYQVNKISNP